MASVYLRTLCLANCFLLAYGATSSGAAPFRVIKASEAPELNALFERAAPGWIGGDGDYSVEVNPDHRLWFFSDSWIGRIEDGKRRRAALSNNSVGVQTWAAGKSAVEYFWQTTPQGKPQALFMPVDGRGWLWPFAGAMIGDRLQLFLWQMEKAPGAAAFGFRNLAVWHAEISNPLDPPDQWIVAQRQIPFAEVAAQRRALYGSALLRHGDYLYIYGVEERPAEKDFGRRMLVARVETRDLGEFGRWRFWDGDDWTADARRAAPLVAGMATEFSVTHVPALDRFVAVCNDELLSPRIVGRVSRRPTGPWSAPVTLYTCPEAAWRKGIFCYAGKAHASLSAADELIISYAANAHELAEVLNDARLYWPKFIRVQLAAP